MILFFQDLARSWTGQLPVAGGPSGGPPKRSKLAQDLIELWNTSYYAPRGVELVLFKGQQRRTKSLAAKAQSFFDSSDDSSDLGSTESSDWEGVYGRAHSRNDRRHEEKRMRRKEKKAKRKAYTVYIACIINAAAAPLGPAVSQPVGFPMPMTAPYGVPPPGYSAFVPPGVTYPMPYGPPVGIPKTRSHGHGSGY